MYNTWRKSDGAPDTLVRVMRRDYQLQALHLPEVRRVAQHVNEQQLGNISLASLLLLIANRGTDGGALFGAC